MTIHTQRIRTWLGAIGLLALVALPPPAAAAPSVAAENARYQRERARCMRLDRDRRPDCLSEASTAHAAALPALPDADPGRYARNALERCKPLREPDRADCVKRMQGQGTVRGSVESGGIYRELVTVTRDGAAAP